MPPIMMTARAGLNPCDSDFITETKDGGQEGSSLNPASYYRALKGLGW